MKFLIVLLFVVGCALAFPRPPQYRRAQQLAAARLRRAPAAAAARQRTMLISGYYRPLYAQRRQGYEPETAMTAFATGENVAAGSYLGTKLQPCATCNEQEQEQFDGPVEQPQLDAEQPEQIPLNDQEAAFPNDTPTSDYVGEAELAPVKPARAPKQKKPAKKVHKEEDEDSEVADEEEAVPSKGRRPYNSFFPIVFSGYPGGARSSAAGGGAGGVTAIANSYSTGKGGVATSHATAYGSGAPARGRKRAPAPVDDEDEE